MSGCVVGVADFLTKPFRYTGTDVLDERDGRFAVFYTFIDSGTPVCLKILRFPRN
jgi:hypothetical protein